MLHAGRGGQGLMLGELLAVVKRQRPPEVGQERCELLHGGAPHGRCPPIVHGAERGAANQSGQAWDRPHCK